MRGLMASVAVFFFLMMVLTTLGTTAIAGHPAVISPLAVESLLLDCASRGSLLVAVGERGHILISHDNGDSWTQSEVPTRATLTAVFFLDETMGWSVGHDAVILRTEDGGVTWREVYSDIEGDRPLFDVWFSDARKGIAVGAYGLVLTTIDGGESWAQQPFQPKAPEGEGSLEDDGLMEVDFHLNKVGVSESGRLYLAGEAGTFFRSDDGGESWTASYPPYEGSFFGVLPLEGDSLLLFGLRGHLFRSDDGGETWSALEIGTEAILTDGVRLSDGTLIVVGLVGTILVSDDDGRTFDLHQQSDRVGISAVVEAIGGRVVTTGEKGVRTIDFLDESDAAP